MRFKIFVTLLIFCKLQFFRFAGKWNEINFVFLELPVYCRLKHFIVQENGTLSCLQINKNRVPIQYPEFSI